MKSIKLALAIRMAAEPILAWIMSVVPFEASQRETSNAEIETAGIILRSDIVREIQL